MLSNLNFSACKIIFAFPLPCLPPPSAGRQSSGGARSDASELSGRGVSSKTKLKSNFIQCYRFYFLYCSKCSHVGKKKKGKRRDQDLSTIIIKQTPFSCQEIEDISSSSCFHSNKKKAWVSAATLQPVGPRNPKRSPWPPHHKWPQSTLPRSLSKRLSAVPTCGLINFRLEHNWHVFNAAWMLQSKVPLWSTNSPTLLPGLWSTTPKQNSSTHTFKQVLKRWH